MQGSKNIVGLRKSVALEVGYGDRNDGFNRSAFSRSKWNFSRIRKEGKIPKGGRKRLPKLV